MAKVKNLELIIDLLEELNKIEGIQNMEIINIPDDVEADIGLKIKLKKGYDWINISHKINDITWDIFEKTGEYLTVYREFDK